LIAQAAFALALLALAGASVSLVRSAPARLLRDARDALDAAANLEAEWHALKVRQTTFQTEIEGLLETIEKKRRQISAADSRQRGGAVQQPDVMSMTPEQLTNMARERGLLA